MLKRDNMSVTNLPQHKVKFTAGRQYNRLHDGSRMQKEETG